MRKPTREKINYILEMCADYHDNWAADFDENPSSEPVGEFDSRDIAALCTALLESMDRVEELEGALDLASNKFGFVTGLTDLMNIRFFAEGAKTFCDKARAPKSLGGSNERA